MKYTTGRAKKFKEKVNNTPDFIKHDFIQNYVEQTSGLRMPLFYLLNTALDIKDKTENPRQIKKLTRFIENIREFSEMNDVLFEECCVQNKINPDEL